MKCDKFVSVSLSLFLLNAISDCIPIEIHVHSSAYFFLASSSQSNIDCCLRLMLETLIMWKISQWFFICSECSWRRNVDHYKSESFAYGTLSLCKYSLLFFPYFVHLINCFMSRIKFVNGNGLNFIRFLYAFFSSFSFCDQIKVASNGVPPSISKRVLLRVQCKLYTYHFPTQSLSFHPCTLSFSLYSNSYNFNC